MSIVLAVEQTLRNRSVQPLTSSWIKPRPADSAPIMPMPLIRRTKPAAGYQACTEAGSHRLFCPGVVGGRGWQGKSAMIRRERRDWEGLSLCVDLQREGQEYGKGSELLRHNFLIKFIYLLMCISVSRRTALSLMGGCVSRVWSREVPRDWCGKKLFWL